MSQEQLFIGAAGTHLLEADGKKRQKKRSHTDIPTQIDCNHCCWRTDQYYCSLPDEVLGDLQARKITRTYSKGTILYLEGELAEGIFILCSGRVKLSAYSENGRSLILRIAEPGQLLGVSAVAVGIPYEATAEVITDCQVNFVKANDFLIFLDSHSTAALKAIRELSLTYRRANSQACSLGLSSTVSDKLAKLLIEWYDRSGANGSGAHIPMSHTHEEIAEMIGTTRETITRILKIFRLQELIAIEKAELFIPDRKRLATVIGTRPGRR